MSLETEHELMSQDARSAKQRSAVETLGNSQDRIFGFASSASSGIPSIVFTERSCSWRLDHVQSRKIFEKTGRRRRSLMRRRRHETISFADWAVGTLVQQICRHAIVHLLLVPAHLAECVQTRKNFW